MKSWTEKINKLRHCLLFILLLLLSNSFHLFAIEESKDTLTDFAKKRANKAALMSALLPGLGQAYNKKYWKIPVIYGGAVTLVYFISVNNSEYKKFNSAIIYRNDNDSSTIDDYPNYTNEDLTVRKNYYRRNRDLSYIFLGLLYTLNIVDAYVDSQLMNFDITDDLSLHSGGKINYLSNGIPVMSLQLVLNFK